MSIDLKKEPEISNEKLTNVLNNMNMDVEKIYKTTMDIKIVDSKGNVINIPEKLEMLENCINDIDTTYDVKLDDIESKITNINEINTTYDKKLDDIESRIKDLTINEYE